MIIDVYDDKNTFQNIRNYLNGYFYGTETIDEIKKRKALKKINRIKDPIRRQKQKEALH